MKLTYAVIGSGALGGYYGGKLARAGHEVNFLFHHDYNFVREHGLTVDSVRGNFHLGDVRAYRDTGAMPACDVVLVCLKTNNNHLLETMLPPLLRENTLVILIQNGIGLEQDLAAQFPGLPVAGGLAFICSSKIGDGHIAHLDYGDLKIGMHRDEHPAVLQQVIRDFNAADVKAEYSPDLNTARWQKLVWNIPYNGMTVVLNTTTERIMKQPASRQMIWDLMMEVIEAANSCGARVGEDFARKMVSLTDNMTPYAPSMKLDFDARRPMEIEAIYTRPVREAGRAGYVMRRTDIIEKQLRFIQSTYGGD